MIKDKHPEDHFLTSRLRPYILEAFRQLKKLKCDVCGAKERLNIHHRRYGPNVTLYDLQLLCSKHHIPWHRAQEKFTTGLKEL